MYDNDTHYVSAHRLTLETLKKLNDIDYVLEVMGDYNGSAASIGPQHDIGDWKRNNNNWLFYFVDCEIITRLKVIFSTSSRRNLNYIFYLKSINFTYKEYRQ